MAVAHMNRTKHLSEHCKYNFLLLCGEICFFLPDVIEGLGPVMQPNRRGQSRWWLKMLEERWTVSTHSFINIHLTLNMVLDVWHIYLLCQISLCPWQLPSSIGTVCRPRAPFEGSVIFLPQVPLDRWDDQSRDTIANSSFCSHAELWNVPLWSTLLLALESSLQEASGSLGDISEALWHRGWGDAKEESGRIYSQRLIL